MHSYHVTFDMVSSSAYDEDVLGDAVKAWVAAATAADSTVGVASVGKVKVKDTGVVDEAEASDEVDDLPPRERRKAIVEQNEKDVRDNASEDS